MKLIKILEKIDYKLIKGSLDIDIKDISYDSRRIKKGFLFVCLIGIDSDGHNYISKAIEKGAVGVITCEDVDIKEDVTVVKINDTRTQLSILSANLFDNPADKLIKIAITGTKGKTSTSFMIKSILEENKEKVGVIGTIGTYINNVLYENKNTTPESYFIQKYMRQMVDEGVKYLIMEASSQALKVGRINNITFDYAIFTNLSMDHVGPREHPTYEDYVNSKMLLFKQSKIGIVNSDDKEYERIKQLSKAKLYTYGENNNSDYTLHDIKYVNNSNFLGTEFKVKGKINDIFNVSSPGEFSAYNALSAIILSSLLKIDINVIKKGLEKFSVEGRCESISINDYSVVIDFAHNRLSMESIISTMKNYNHNRIIAVYGCGGGRSKKLRYELGEVGGKLCDLNIITEDNSRNDDLDDIISDITKGIKDNDGEYKIIKDRKKAREYALSIAEKNDIILILGKGHEKFQEIKGIKYPFDEKKIINDYIKK